MSANTAVVDPTRYAQQTDERARGAGATWAANDANSTAGDITSSSASSSSSSISSGGAGGASAGSTRPPHGGGGGRSGGTGSGGVAWNDSVFEAVVALGSQGKPWHEANGSSLSFAAMQNKRKIKELKTLLRNGIPDTLRPEKWKKLLQATGLGDHNTNIHLTQRIATFSDLQTPLFGSEPLFDKLALSPEGIKIANQIMYAISTDFPQLSYCPFVVAIVTILLHRMEPSDTVSSVVAMVQESISAGDWRYFPCSNREIQLFTFVFVDEAKRSVPLVWQHVKKVTNNDGKLSWQPFWKKLFCSMFIGSIPLPQLFTTMDSFCLEGCKIFFRIGLGALAMLEKDILNQGSLDAINDVIIKTFSSLDAASFTAIYSKGLTFQVNRTDLAAFRQTNQNLHKEQLDRLHEDEDGATYAKALPEMSNPSAIVIDHMLQEIWKWVPSRFQNCDLDLLFTTASDGYSLNNMYQKCGKAEPILMFFKASTGQPFGLFLTDAFSKWPKAGINQYYGSGECFVFRLTPSVEVWPWAKMDRAAMIEDRRGKRGLHQTVRYLENKDTVNSFFIRASEKGLAIGGGSGQALIMDNDFRNARSSWCETFENEPLAGDNESVFDCVAVEVYRLN